MSGIVYLVGAGPGDPGLLTVKGLQAIQQADVILYDRLVNLSLLKYARAETERIDVGKLPDRHPLTQAEINRLLVEKAQAGKRVIRLKGGDPYVFGRGGEEAEYCVAAGVPFEVVPGITSAIAVPAYAGIPVTHRDFNASFSIITGHERPEKTTSSLRWDRLATATETLIFLMGVSNLSFIIAQLLQHGRPPETPIALVRWGTRIEQETLVGTLANMVQKVKAADFRPPAIGIVGEVVKLREKLAWFEKRPLFGKRILVTRARSQSSLLCEKIAALGGEAIQFPVIRLTRPKRQALLDQALSQLAKYDWVIFTSVNGVKYFFQRLVECKQDIRQLVKARLAAIGPKTGEALLEKGLQVEVLPEVYQAEALVESLRPWVEAGQEILLPRADIAREVLGRELIQMGCRVTEVDAYDTEMEAEGVDEVVALLQQGRIQVITFTSSSTVRNFMAALRAVAEDVSSLLTQAHIVCIGPITAQTATAFGLRVDQMAASYTIDGLVEAIQQLPTERRLAL
jgi:uroporphyrinogen III methyltransferase / synthase